MIGDSTKHIFKLFNVKTIIAVFDATFAVAKRKPENIQVCTGIRTFELYAITVQHSIYHVPIGYKSEMKTKDEIIMCK